MRIALWLPTSLQSLGGGVKWITDVAELLNAKGYNVVVFGTPFYTHKGKTLSFERRLNKLGIPMIEQWLCNINNFDVCYLLYSPLIRLVKVKSPSILGIHTPVYYLKDFLYPNQKDLMLWMGKIYYSLFSRIDFKSFDAIHSLNKILLSYAKKQLYIPNWVNTSFYKPNQFKNKKFTIFYVGQHNEREGWDILVNIKKLFHSDHYDIQFISTGEPYNGIRGLGYIEERNMPKYYSQSHICFLPRKGGVFPLTFLESLSCGTPVLTSSIITHKVLDLPIMYSSCIKDYFNIISKLYNYWNNEPYNYLQWCSSLRKKILKYDQKKIFPLIEKSFIKIANKN